MRLVVALSLLFVSCKQSSVSDTYHGANFRCNYPRSWKVVKNFDEPGRASVEFDFPGPGFATVTVFKPENQGAFERYTRSAAEKFPLIHERDHPDQPVSTISSCKNTKLGSLDALQSVFSVAMSPDHRRCTFTYVDLTSAEWVALVDIFDEGTPLGVGTTATLEKFIATITPRKSAGTKAQSADSWRSGNPLTQPALPPASESR
jgi:hypothetical protein